MPKSQSTLAAPASSLKSLRTTRSDLLCEGGGGASTSTMRTKRVPGHNQRRTVGKKVIMWWLSYNHELKINKTEFGRSRQHRHASCGRSRHRQPLAKACTAIRSAGAPIAPRFVTTDTECPRSARRVEICKACSASPAAAGGNAGETMTTLTTYGSHYSARGAACTPIRCSGQWLLDCPLSHGCKSRAAAPQRA